MIIAPELILLRRRQRRDPRPVVSRRVVRAANRRGHARAAGSRRIGAPGGRRVDARAAPGAGVDRAESHSRVPQRRPLQPDLPAAPAESGAAGRRRAAPVAARELARTLPVCGILQHLSRLNLIRISVLVECGRVCKSDSSVGSGSRADRAGRRRSSSVSTTRAISPSMSSVGLSALLARGAPRHAGHRERGDVDRHRARRRWNVAHSRRRRRHHAAESLAARRR